MSPAQLYFALKQAGVRVQSIAKAWSEWRWLRIANGGFSGFATGFTLTLIHIAGIPITGVFITLPEVSDHLIRWGQSYHRISLFIVAALLQQLCGGYLVGKINALAKEGLFRTDSIKSTK